MVSAEATEDPAEPYAMLLVTGGESLLEAAGDAPLLEAAGDAPLLDAAGEASLLEAAAADAVAELDGSGVDVPLAWLLV